MKNIITKEVAEKKVLGKDVVSKVVRPRQRTRLEHPNGLRLVIGSNVFARNTKIGVMVDTKAKLAHAGYAFRVSSTKVSARTIYISIRVEYKPHAQSAAEKPVAFVEIQQSHKSRMVAGTFREHLVGKRKEYWVTARCALFKEERDVSIGGGLFFHYETEFVFHPVQHQFKIREQLMDKYADGSCRRRDDLGGDCVSASQNLYPACYPAAWASLFSAYPMTSLHPRRQWEIGTPTETNRPPREFGDPFSTWVMGTNPPGASPEATRVEDWVDDPGDPTPTPVCDVDGALIVEEFSLDDGLTLEERTALIKNVLLEVVGGDAPRPVRLYHSGHAGVVVGVDKDGFWAHAFGDNAWNLSDRRSWDKASWVDDEVHRTYWIAYPDCPPKPQAMRLGCITIAGSNDVSGSVRFVDVRSSCLDVDGHFVDTINWSPHTETDSGYLWIQGNTPLTCEGSPRFLDHPILGPILGHGIPMPMFDPCIACGDIEGGCGHCRLRLLLPFWVHNTTLDESLTYRVDLFFWTKDDEWVPIGANSIQHDEYGGHYGFKEENWWADYALPGPLPGEEFMIEARPDSLSSRDRSKPWGSQGFAWYVDLHRRQLKYSVHGIRLVLTCLESSYTHEPVKQDAKQIWFHVVSGGRG